MFDIPVVLFTFKRTDTVLRIIDRIRQVRPQKIYILSDQGRTSEEIQLVEHCRGEIEKAIDWPCTVIKNYASENRGVHANIGLGAKWVFEREKYAIFLEDDNLPEVTFFDYCKELLEKYDNDNRIIWICGTNYLGEYTPENKASYMFTRHLLPCGWASWSDKFNKYYDESLSLAEDDNVMSEMKQSYSDEKLYKQQLESIFREKRRKERGERFGSWDYHMALTIRANNLFGIAPCKNQIKNIGVDSMSIHGGNSMANIMTRRFCNIESHPLEFPLIHPRTVLTDSGFEKKISDIILLPLRYRVKAYANKKAKKILGVGPDESLSSAFRKTNN